MIDIGKTGLRSIWQPALGNPSLPLSEQFLLVVLHGRGDSAEGFEDLLPELGLPGLNALLLNAPDPYYTGYSWYELPPHQLPGIRRSRATLEKVFEEIGKQGFPAQRCFMLGFSQGCLMTLEFGSRYSRRLGGYVGISGYCYDESAIIQECVPANREGNWLVTHGTLDSVLPVERTRKQIEELKKAGFKVDYQEYPKDHTIDPGVELPYIREWLRARMASL